MVGIAPVPPDRLPSRLPDRLSFPLVITVQTDGGQNFDRPVPVQFPNLPNAKTGKLLAAGEKTALWSFNHDIGDWEVVGSMTISADGKFAVTDPGVGIRAPGWHGTNPGSGGGCDKPKGGGGGGGGGGGAGGGGGSGGVEGGDGGEEGDNPTGGDGPDGPDSGPTNGGSSENGSSGGSEDCATGDCGCDLVGAFIEPAESEAPKSVQDLSDPLKATSPNGLYKLQVFNSSSGVTLEVKKAVGGTTVLLVGPLPMEVWGFSPDDHRFVYTFKDTSGNSSVWLHDLENPTSGGPGSPFISVWNRTVSAASYSLGFSPHGNYLLFVYNLRSSNKHVDMVAVKAKGGVAYESEYDVNAVAGVGSPSDSAGWGWGPECDDRSLVYAFVGTPSTSTVRLVNLKKSAAIFDRTLNVGEGEWKFSKCGDAFGLWHFGALLGPGQAILLKTKDGTILLDSSGIPGGPISFSTEADHHVVDVAGLKTQFPNDAAKPCPSTMVAKAGSPRGRVTAKAITPAVDALPVSTGLHYYALKDLTTGQIVERGLAGSAGVVHNRLILGVNRPYRSYVIKAINLNVGWSDFISGNNGQQLRLPDVVLRNDPTPDTDGDGLHDLGELIMGTNPSLKDSDGDGVSDSAEVIQGSDPNSGLAVQTGMIAGAPTAGRAVDVVALNGLAAVATMDAGVALFSVFNGLAPTLAAQVSTPGTANGVALSGAFVAVADGSAGLAVIDALIPTSAFIVRQVPLGGDAQSVAASAGVAYVGLVNGDLVAVDLSTGTILDKVHLPSSVHDVALGKDVLYALVPGSLHVIDIQNEALAILKTVSAPGGPGAGGRRLRLFAGSDRAYSSFTAGFNAFDTTDPLNPVLIKQNNTTSFGWIQIIGNGSGGALAAVGPASTDDGPHNVSLYDLGPNQSDANVVATFETPGLATALSIYNGILYVADGNSGLTVINYLSYDTKGQPPTIALDASFPLNPAQAEEGKNVRLTAKVTDDVQVRSVEFYFDDVLIATDGNFPFETRAITPARGPGKSTFTLKAKATDTGGNFTWAGPITVALVADATPPKIKKVFPGPSDVISSASEVTIYFSEPMDTGTLNTTTLDFTYGGADNLLGTPDDSKVAFSMNYRADINAASLIPLQPMGAGVYRLQINGVRDLAQNPAAPLVNSFWILPGGPDGDPDHDDLINSDEIKNHTNPTIADTDGDGWIDGLEVADGRDPLNPNSFPKSIVVAAPPTQVYLLSVEEKLDPAKSLAFARPPVAVEFLDVDELTPSVFVLARPPLAFNFPSLDETSQNGLVVARPPVGIYLPTSDEVSQSSFIVARPPVGIYLPISDEVSQSAFIVAKPPIGIQFPSPDEQFSQATTHIAVPQVSVKFANPLQQAQQSSQHKLIPSL